MSATHQITITNNHGSRNLAQYRTVFLEIDHAALVTAGRSFADGRDLGIIYGTVPKGSESHRLEVFVRNPNTTATQIFFSLQESLAFGEATDSYWLKIGDEHRSLRGTNEILNLSQLRIWADDNSQYVARRQPFLWYDEWEYKSQGGAGFALYDDFDQPSSHTYERVDSGVRVRIDSGIYTFDFMQIPLTGAQNAVLPLEDCEDTTEPTLAWTDVSTRGIVNWKDTTNPISGSRSLRLTWNTPASAKDSQVFTRVQTGTSQDSSSEYLAFRFAWRMNSGFTQSNSTSSEICSMGDNHSTRAYVYLNTNGVGAYTFQLQQVSPNILTSGTSWTLAHDTVYYIEVRSYPDQSTGGVMLKVYSDAGYSTELAQFGIDGTGGGWNQETLIDTFRLGTIADGNKNMSGTQDYDNILAFDRAAGDYNMVEGQYPWGDEAGLRIRGDFLITAGADDPSAGVYCMGQAGDDSVYGFTLGFNAAYGEIALYERHSNGTNTEIASQSCSDAAADTWVHMALGCYYSGGTAYLYGSVGDSDSGKISGSDASAFRTGGLPGVWQHGAGSSDYIRCRWLAVELWDGVPDSDIDVDVAVAAATLPECFDNLIKEQYGQPVSINEYPDYNTVRGGSVAIVDTNVVEVKWEHLPPAEMTELRAFYIAELGGATKFVATIPGVATDGNFKIVPGSLRYMMVSPTSYAASLKLRKIW